MSEVNVDTVSEYTSNNGVAIDTFTFVDGITTASKTISGTSTIASGTNGLIIGPADVTGTINIAGNVRVI